MTATRKFPRAKPYRRTSLDTKALVRHRDGYRCQVCGMTAREHYRRYKKALDVHRLIPGSRYTVKGCITACRKCHKKLHGDGRKVVALFARVDAPLGRFWKQHILTLEQKTSSSAMVETLIKRHLQAKGRWPADPEQPESPS